MAHQNNARTKNPHNKFASDEDASNLLADILNDTAMDAEAEQRRIEAELKAREAEERRAREAEERKREEEAAARLHAEQSRQNQVQQRRTEKLQALKIEELKEKGEWVDPAIEEAKRKAEEERQRQAQLQAAIQQQVVVHQQAQAVQHAPTPEAKKGGKGAIIGLVAVLILVLGAGGAIAAMTVGSYKPDASSYAKVTLAPKDAKASLTTAQYALLPKAEPAAAPVDGPKTKRPSSAARPDKKPAKPAKPNAAGFLKGLDEDDIFGGKGDL